MQFPALAAAYRISRSLPMSFSKDSGTPQKSAKRCFPCSNDLPPRDKKSRNPCGCTGITGDAELTYSSYSISELLCPGTLENQKSRKAAQCRRPGKCINTQFKHTNAEKGYPGYASAEPACPRVCHRYARCNRR